MWFGEISGEGTFVELLKGSMQTFLNAFTFGDKTMYPVASRNEQDFSNLMEVYLDSVFQPNIYKQKEIFEQEGWHYELQQTEAELIYKGVVYNEMKGSYSSPFTVLMDRIKSRCIQTRFTVILQVEIRRRFLRLRMSNSLWRTAIIIIRPTVIFICTETSLLKRSCNL